MSRRTGKTPQNGSKFGGSSGGVGNTRNGPGNQYRAREGEENKGTGYGGSSTLLERCRREDMLDAEFGFNRLNDSPVDQTRLGWLYNAHPVRSSISS